NGDLVAGGCFTGAGGAPDTAYIARWNGSVWAPVGTGTNSTVTELIVLPDGDLVAGGGFYAAGGVGAYCIARWNGSNWASLGTGTSVTVYAPAVLPNADVAVGALLTTVEGVAVNDRART